MPVTIELPEEIERRLHEEWRDLPRRALEALALEGYRSEALTRGQVGQMLGLDFWQTEAFLRERGAFLQYTSEDLAQDRRTQERLLPR
jgi:predicted HTH domain antitoxin